ncbi:MAG: phosphate ABC transporter ATP-binding protein PstB [Roseiflexaceae bacterium]
MQNVITQNRSLGFGDLIANRERTNVASGAVQAKIEVRNFSFYYGKFKAINDVTMDIPANRVTAIIGPSGCGKSTMLRAINRMHDATIGAYGEGELRIDGENVYADNVDSVLLRRNVGMVFQRPNPFQLSIFDNVAYGLRVLGMRNKRDIEQKVEESLRRAALWDEVKDRLHKSYGTALSGGQQQRLCIARAIATTPEVILMDEPCSALDPIASLKVEELIDALRNQFTIVMVTHNMQQAARVSDITAFMLMNRETRAGELVEIDDTDKLFTDPADKRTEDYISGQFG